jgi:hypothetical protein
MTHLYKPLITFINYPELRANLCSPTVDKSSLVGSFLKSLATSCNELQSGAEVYVKSLSRVAKFPSPWFLINGDIKIENLMLDVVDGTIRMSDLDAVVVVQPKHKPIAASVLTSPKYAPPGSSMSPLPAVLQPHLNFHVAFPLLENISKLVHDRFDIYMIADAVVRMFTDGLPIPRVWSGTTLANMLKMPDDCPLVGLLVRCHDTDLTKRPFLDQLLHAVAAYDVDAFAHYLRDNLPRWDSEAFAELAMSQVVPDSLVSAQFGLQSPLTPTKVSAVRAFTDSGEQIESAQKGRMKDVIAKMAIDLGQAAAGSRLDVLFPPDVPLNEIRQLVVMAGLKMFLRDYVSEDVEARIFAINSVLKGFKTKGKGCIVTYEGLKPLLETKYFFAVLGHIVIFTHQTPFTQKFSQQRLLNHCEVAKNNVDAERTAAKIAVGLHLVYFALTEPTTPSAVTQ